MFQFLIFCAVILATTVAAQTYITGDGISDELLFTNAAQVTNQHEYHAEMMDLLGLEDRPNRIKRLPSLQSAASKFLLEVYDEIAEDDNVKQKHQHGRYKRSPRGDIYITEHDRLEFRHCNNIITFAGKKTQILKNHTAPMDNAQLLQLQFNTKDVPKDFQLVYATLRLYQDPSLGLFSSVGHGDTNNRDNHVDTDEPDAQKLIISIYQQLYNRRQQTHEYRILSSLNSTVDHKGWLEFNVTRLLGKWLQRKSTLANVILIGAALQSGNASNNDASGRHIEVNAADYGIVGASDAAAVIDLQPFVIGYFNGPELLAKIQKLRFKREALKRKRSANYYLPSHAPPPPQPSFPNVYHMPKSCERLNFTLDFKDLHMHNWVIAPKKFEAYFCGGECNFPLNSHMNATNHAIVQTLMHLKRPNLPKPCCVPTVLGSISILHYLNEDSVNLSKYPQSVAKQCGCH